MNVNVRIPDKVANRITADGGDLERRALEGLVLEEFRAGRITKRELRDAPGFEVLNEVNGFPEDHNFFEDCTIEDIHLDVQTLERLGFRGTCLSSSRTRDRRTTWS